MNTASAHGHGADNGLSMAAIMAVMEDKTLKHGPVKPFWALLKNTLEEIGEK